MRHALQDLGRDDSDTFQEYQTASRILQKVYKIIKQVENK